MPIEITMPKLSDTMTEGTLVKWLKREGEAIKPGDIIAEVETDKATQELEAFETGVIAKQVVPEGGKAEVGGVIVVIAKPGEDAAQVAAGVKVTPGAAPAGGGGGEACRKAGGRGLGVGSPDSCRRSANRGPCRRCERCGRGGGTDDAAGEVAGFPPGAPDCRGKGGRSGEGAGNRTGRTDHQTRCARGGGQRATGATHHAPGSAAGPSSATCWDSRSSGGGGGGEGGHR